MIKFALWLVISAVIAHVGLAGMYWLLIRESTERVDTQRYPLAVNGRRACRPNRGCSSSRATSSTTSA